MSDITVNITEQVVEVNVTEQVVDVNVGNVGPQGPVGPGVAAGGTTNQILAKASGADYDTVWVDAGLGTVQSVNASGDVGISVTGGPITSVGTLTITNTAPDQIVALTGTGTTSVSGTYPNFTINSDDQFDGTVTSVDLSAGTGISVSGGPITVSGSITVTNTAPDQVVSLTGSGTTTISGTYPNFTISSADSNVGTVTSVDITVPTGLTVSGNPITSAGTLAVALASGYVIPTQTTLDGLVPYTGATTNVNLGTFDLSADAIAGNTGAFSSSGSGDTFGITHSSGSGIALNITKGGNGEGLYVNKTGGSGNAATIVGTLNATTLVKNGGTSSQFLKADGSVDSTAYGLGSVTSVAALTLGTTGTDLSSTVANGTTTPVITLQVPTASASNRGALSSTDWTTFNAKEPAITAGTSSQYFRGDKTFQTLDTLAVPENTNLYFTEDRVRTSLLTGLNLASGGTIAATDNVLVAFGKVQNQISALVGGVNYDGTWDASTNTPTIVSGTGSKGDYYVVSTAGSTNIDGITDWKIGDWIIFNGTTWDKVDNTDAVSSVNGYTGTVSLVTGDVLEGSGSLPSRPSQLYFTDARARAAISLTVSGASGASTYDSATGVLNVPTYTLSGLGGVPLTRTLTINGTSLDLSENRSFSVGTVTSVAALTLGTTGTDVSSSVANGTTTPVITLNIPTASAANRGALSSADWTTFNGKQAALNGTGFVKISGTTISYDNSTYLTTSSASSTYLPLAGGTLTGALGGTTATFSGNIVASGTGNIVIQAASSNNFPLFQLVDSRVGGTTWNIEGGRTLGNLQFRSSIAGATVLEITASGNLGLGVTPSAWWSGARSMQIGLGGSIAARTSSDFAAVELSANQIINASAQRVYIGTGFASLYEQFDGAHKWLTAPSGTAGNAISFTQAMTLDASGRLGIGTTAPGSLLQVGSTAVSSGEGPLRVYGFDGAADFYTTRQESNFNAALYLHNNPSGTVGNGTGILFRARSSSTDSRVQGAIYTSWTTSTDASRTAKMVFQTVDSGTNSDRVTILGNGNVGIGTTSPDQKLTIQAQGSSNGLISFKNSSGTTTSFVGVPNANGDVISSSTTADLCFRNETGNMLFQTFGSERMRITSGGNVGIGTTSPSEKLEVNGAIKTAAPSGGTAKPIKFGAVQLASSLTGDALQVEVDGVTYLLGIVGGP